MSNFEIQIKGPAGKVTSRGWAKEITPVIVGNAIEGYFFNAIYEGASLVQEGEITINIRYPK